MKIKPRILALSAITTLTAVIFVVLAFSQADYRVNLSSVLNLWGDFVRDVDQVGLTATRVSDETEMEIGRGIAARIARQVVTNEWSQYITEVGQRMVPHVQRKGIEYQFHVLRSPHINAHALPGGQIYVTTAMLEFVESEAELAAVIGHEIAHVDLRHSIERLQYEHAARKVVGRDLATIVRLGHQLLVVGFSEQQELEADATGLLLAAEAGYDPGAAVRFFDRMSGRIIWPVRVKPRTMTGEAGRAVSDVLVEYFQTHPRGSARVQMLLLAYVKNTEVWEDRSFYLGRTNLADRQSRLTSERDSEWVDFQINPMAQVLAEEEASAEPVESVGPVELTPDLRSLTDREVCYEVLSSNSDYVREAERRGLTEAHCRALIYATPDAASAPADHIEPLNEIRTTKDNSTSVRAAPQNDAPLLGYVGGEVRVTGWTRDARWYRITWTKSELGFVRAEALDPVSMIASFTDEELCYVLNYENPEFVLEAQKRGLTDERCRALIGVISPATYTTRKSRGADGQWNAQMTCGSCPGCSGPLRENLTITIKSGLFQLKLDKSYTGAGLVAADDTVRVWWHAFVKPGYEKPDPQIFRFLGRISDDKI